MTSVFFVSRDVTRYLCVGIGVALLVAFALTTSALAQAPTPAPAPTPQVKALSVVQMQQLTIVQLQRRAAAEEAAKYEAQERALTLQFAWQLEVNPEAYDQELKPLDERGQTWGFLPKPKPPAPVEPNKEGKPEPKQDGKQ